MARYPDKAALPKNTGNDGHHEQYPRQGKEPQPSAGLYQAILKELRYGSAENEGTR